MIEDQEARQPATPPLCPKCGAALRHQGQKATPSESRLRGIGVERGYYYCAHCESGPFPLSAQLQVVDERSSPGVARHAVWLADLVPYDQTAAILAQNGSLHVSASTIWWRVQAWGRKVAAQEAAEQVQVQALPVKWTPTSRAEKSDQRLGGRWMA